LNPERSAHVRKRCRGSCNGDAIAVTVTVTVAEAVIVAQGSKLDE
jgi:hypothetical protein